MDAKEPWNKGRKVGIKPHLTRMQVGLIAGRLEQDNALRDLAMFRLAIDSMLRGSDLIRLDVGDVMQRAPMGGWDAKQRSSIIQKKTRKEVAFTLSEEAGQAVQAWLAKSCLWTGDYLFPSPRKKGSHLTERAYANLIKKWVKMAGLDAATYGTHSLRRTKAAYIYQQTGNLRAVQLLLGHSSINSTAHYLGIEVDDALTIAKRISF